MDKGHKKKTQKQMDYVAQWEAANYDKVLIRFPRGTKDRITATGATVNGYTVSAVTDRLDGKAQPDTPPATGDTLTINPQPDMKYNERIQILIDAGITSSVSEYILSVIGDNLDRELSYNGVSLWRYEHGTTEPRHK